MISVPNHPDQPPALCLPIAPMEEPTKRPQPKLLHVFATTAPVTSLTTKERPSYTQTYHLPLDRIPTDETGHARRPSPPEQKMRPQKNIHHRHARASLHVLLPFSPFRGDGATETFLGKKVCTPCMDTLPTRVTLIRSRLGTPSSPPVASRSFFASPPLLHNI